MNNLEYEEIDDLKKIKKDYGENMSHMCRELFPTILEKPGLLYHIISTHFSKSRYLYDDIINDSKKYEFKNFTYFLYDEIIDFKKKQKDNRTVREILSEKGYTLYECKTNEDIRKFKKYYKSGEALCTFRDSNRINNHYIFFIVKNNADEIKREIFQNPKREDEYSTSVLDLQFDKGTRQRVSIKSRYNHTVANPDATYSNNLENIAEGLTEAFEREYGFNIGNEYKVDFELDHYVLARDNKYYKYNFEINNIHYCPNNIIIDDGKVIDKYLDKSRYIVIDYFIMDKQEKNITLYDSSSNDSFIDGLDNIINIEVINEDKDKNIKIIQTGGRKVIIKVDNLGRIIKYENNYLKECGENFLCDNNTLQELNLPELQNCGDYFLCYNNTLQELNLPKLQNCGDNFLYKNNTLQELYLPELQSYGEDFVCDRFNYDDVKGAKKV